MRVEVTTGGQYEDAVAVINSTRGINLQQLRDLAEGAEGPADEIALAMLSWAPFIDDPGYFLLYLRALERVKDTIMEVYNRFEGRFPSLLTRYIQRCPDPPSIIVIRNIAGYGDDNDAFKAYLQRDDGFDPEIGVALHGGGDILLDVLDRPDIMRQIAPRRPPTQQERELIEGLRGIEGGIVVDNTSMEDAPLLAGIRGWDLIELESPSSPFTRGVASFFVVGNGRLLGYMTLNADERGITLELIHRLRWAREGLGDEMMKALLSLGRDIYLTSEDKGSGKLDAFYERYGGERIGGKQFLIKAK